MKVRPFRTPRRLLELLGEMRITLRGVLALLSRYLFLSLAWLIGAFALGRMLWPHDAALLAEVHTWSAAAQPLARNVAWYIGLMGDYPTYNLPLALLLWAIGTWTRRRALLRLAVACFLGATLAGLFDDCFRLTLGRPRPDTHLPDGLYGITYAWYGGYQSFPSGHAASVFGTAFSLLVLDLPLGVLTTVIAVVVCWARLELDKHYPSDVLVGGLIGIYFGLLSGWGARLRWPRAPLDTAERRH